MAKVNRRVKPKKQNNNKVMFPKVSRPVGLSSEGKALRNKTAKVMLGMFAVAATAFFSHGIAKGLYSGHKAYIPAPNSERFLSEGENVGFIVKAPDGTIVRSTCEVENTAIDGKNVTMCSGVAETAGRNVLFGFKLDNLGGNSYTGNIFTPKTSSTIVSVIDAKTGEKFKASRNHVSSFASNSL